MRSTKERFAADYLTGLLQLISMLPLEPVARLLEQLELAQRNDRQIFVMGNGGSAATASHLACDLAKNTWDPAKGLDGTHLRVVSLSDNVPWITALANDRGYENIFADQLRVLVRPNDLVIAVSGSGNSPNIIEGVRVARALGAKVVGLLGFDGGRVRSMLDDYILVPTDRYGYVEDMHLVLNHIFVSYMKYSIGGQPIPERLGQPISERAVQLMVQATMPVPDAAD